MKKSLLAVLLVLCSLYELPVAAGTPTCSSRYEYQTLTAEQPTVNEQQLNEMGAEGWLLQTVYQFGEDWVYVFARTVGESS